MMSIYETANTKTNVPFLHQNQRLYLIFFIFLLLELTINETTRKSLNVSSPIDCRPNDWTKLAGTHVVPAEAKHVYGQRWVLQTNHDLIPCLGKL